MKWNINIRYAIKLFNDMVYEWHSHFISLIPNREVMVMSNLHFGFVWNRDNMGYPPVN